MHIWIMLIDRSEARLFSAAPGGRNVRWLRDFPHPQGRLKNQDIDADRPGRSFDRATSRHALSRAVDPVHHVREVFAKELAEFLNHARIENAYTHLALIAEPGVLGAVRAHLSPETSALVIATKASDYIELDDNQQKKRVGEFVRAQHLLA